MTAAYLCLNGTRVPFEKGKAYFVCRTPEKKIELHTDHAQARTREILGLFCYIIPLEPRDNECSFTVLNHSRYRLVLGETKVEKKTETVYTSQVLLSSRVAIVLESRDNPEDTLEFRVLD